MPLFRSLGCTLLLALPYPAVAQSASAPAQRQIVAAVDAGQADAVALLGRLVEQNSGTYNPAGVEAVALMLTPTFEALGFAVEWKPMTQTKRCLLYTSRCV